MRGRERTPTLVDKNATVSKQTNKIIFFVWWWGVAQPIQVSGGGWTVDKSMVVDKDTQIKQR